MKMNKNSIVSLNNKFKENLFLAESYELAATESDHDECSTDAKQGLDERLDKVIYFYKL